MSAGNTNILLIEDDKHFADMASRMLKEVGEGEFNIHIKGDLASGIEFLNHNACNVVLLDLHLPDSQGLSTVRSVHERFPEMPIVVLTGLLDEGFSAGALTAGAQDFFEKTEISPKLLNRIIAYAIERNDLKMALAQEAKSLESKVQKRTEQLELAGRQWQKTFDAVPDMIAIIDKQHKVIHANKSLAQRLGMSQEEMRGASCFALIHKKDEPLIDCPHSKLLEDGREHILESYEESLDAELLLSTSPLNDENGELIGSVHVARDITAIKKAQKALEENEARYRMFLDLLPDPTIIYDIEGRVVFSNQAFEKTFGWNLKDLQNKKVDFVPPEARDETIAKVKQMMDGLPVREFQSLRLTKNNKRLVVKINTSPIFDHKGVQTGNIVIMRDITALVKAEKAIRTSEERYRLLVENMNEGISMLDAQARVTFVNQQMARMLSYEPEELIGIKFRDIFDETNRKVFDQRWAERHEGKKGSYEHVFQAKDGRAVNTIVSPTPLFDQEGEFMGSFALVMDITKRHQLEMQLMQAQKMEGIGQLAAGIAHEINTPTQYVYSNNHFLMESFSDLQKLLGAQKELLDQIVQEGYKTDEAAELKSLAEELDYEFLTEEIPKALEANQEGLDRIAKIVLSMKQFAHPGAEIMVPTDLNKCIENTITVAKSEWKYVSAMETDLAPGLPMVPCVAGEINQVILNLIVNAAHAIADKVAENEEEIGTINISTRQDGGYAEMRVSDTGRGVPEEIRHRIFDPFFTTKEPGKGTGQGLAIAYRYIVDHHKGSIELESEKGVGATFTVRIPLEESPENEHAK